MNVSLNGTGSSESAIKNDESQEMIFNLGFYVQIPICLIGFCLNVVNLAVLSHNIIHSPLYFLMSALACADGVTLLLRAPQGLLGLECWPLCNHIDMRVYIYLFILFGEVPITNITENISSWLTLALAIERYLAMKHHGFSKVYANLRNFKRLVSIIFVSTTVLNLPYFFIYKVRTYYELNPNTNESHLAVSTEVTSFSNTKFYLVHSWLRPIIVQLLPLLLLCIFNFLLLQIIYTHNRKFSSLPRTSVNSTFDTTASTSNNNSDVHTKLLSQRFHKPEGAPAVDKPISMMERKLKAQKRLTILLSTIILVFLIGQIPHAFAYVKVYQALSNCVGYVEECFQYRMFRICTMILTLTCYSSTFFIYAFLNTHFRATICCGEMEDAGRQRGAARNGAKKSEAQTANIYLRSRIMSIEKTSVLDG